MLKQCNMHTSSIACGVLGDAIPDVIVHSADGRVQMSRADATGQRGRQKATDSLACFLGFLPCRPTGELEEMKLWR